MGRFYTLKFLTLGAPFTWMLHSTLLTVGVDVYRDHFNMDDVGACLYIWYLYAPN